MLSGLILADLAQKYNMEQFRRLFGLITEEIDDHDQRQRQQSAFAATSPWVGSSRCRLPNETWVECMSFLNRDQLETLELFSRIHKHFVYQYFEVYPLRKVDRCKVKTKCRKTTEILLICLATVDRPLRTIQTNSDLHLWLRNCLIECIEFNDFIFTNDFLNDLSLLDTSIKKNEKRNVKSKDPHIQINYSIFDYSKAPAKETIPLSADHLNKLFSIGPFMRCQGLIFSFNDRSKSYQPKIDTLLSLSQYSVIIDLDEYVPTNDDYKAISKWLNTTAKILEKQQLQKYLQAPTVKALSLRGFVFEMETSSPFLDIIVEDFLRSTTRQSFLLESDWIEFLTADEFVTTTVTNPMTEELLTIKTGRKFTVSRN